jgi:hypothetical protein
MALVLCLCTSAQAYPKPSAYPVSWELKFEYQTPKRIVIQQAGADKPQAYWYMTYTVTNLGHSGVNFLPVFEMMTEDGTVTRSDKDIPQVVYDEIRVRERDKHIETVNQIAGTVRTGEDQARDGMAVWPEPKDFGGRFQIFVSGLSGEGQILKDDKGNRVEHTNKDGKKEPVVLWKTFRIQYQLFGEDRRPGHENVERLAEEWIMR